jgi:hypothetical protein
MTRLSASTLALLSAALVSVCFATAQAPTQPTGPRPKPKNLKVLPAKTTGDEIDKIMKQYRGDLGVKCEFCHEGNDDPDKINYASDENPTKEVARYMINMTADLNDKYLAEMPDRMYADPITCGTCHRGAKHPSVFVPAPRPDPPAAK